MDIMAVLILAIVIPRINTQKRCTNLNRGLVEIVAKLLACSKKSSVTRAFGNLSLLHRPRGRKTVISSIRSIREGGFLSVLPDQTLSLNLSIDILCILRILYQDVGC